jgi:hypothetical protein
MRLSSPTKKVFNWSIIIACVAVVAFVVSFFVLTAILGWVAFALLLIAFVLLMLGCALKGF